MSVHRPDGDAEREPIGQSPGQQPPEDGGPVSPWSREASEPAASVFDEVLNPRAGETTTPPTAETEAPPAERTSAEPAPTELLSAAHTPTEPAPAEHTSAELPSAGSAPAEPAPPVRPPVAVAPSEWVDDAPTDPRLPVLTPPAPLPPRSRPAAVLLNLTGIGLGYAYLGRWLRAWVSTVVAAALVLVAFSTDAAASPWLWRVVAVVWLAVLALDAARIAARHPRPAERRARTRSALAGALGVVVVAAAYVGYGVAGRDAYADGLAAQARGDCAAATEEFDAVTGRYELTLSRDVAAAARARVECAAYTEATEAQHAGDHDTAVERYLRFRRDHPGSALAPHVRDNLVRTYTAWARQLRDEGQFTQAIDVYRDLVEEDPSYRAEAADTYLRLARKARPDSVDVLTHARGSVDALLVIAREFGDTPAAGEVPAALDAVYGEAAAPYARGEFCTAIPVLEYFAGLTDPAAGKVAGDARANLPRGVLECGLGHLRDGRSAEAVTALQRFVDTFPEHGDAPQARSALISAKVAVGTGARLPVPAPLGAQGPISVTFFNGVSVPVDVRVAGSTAHEFTLPGCGSCPSSFPPLGGDAACPTFAGLPAHTVRLNAGEHHVLGEYGSADELAEAFSVGGGQPSLYCIYLERRF